MVQPPPPPTTTKKLTVTKLIRIPSQEGISRIGINGPQHTVGGRNGNVMLGRVTRQRRVIGLNVEFEMLRQPVLVQEGDTGLGVVIVLVFARFAGLGFEEELRLVALSRFVVQGHFEHGRHVVAFFFHVGIQEGMIALSSTPKDVVRTPELVVYVHDLLDLGRRVTKDVYIGTRHGAVHVAGVTKEVLRRPEELHTRGLLLFQHVIRHLIHIHHGRFERICLGGHVKVVKGVVVHTQLIVEEAKGEEG